MEFIKVLKINKDRLGVIIGKNGEQKRFIESTFNVKLDIDSRNNEVKITASDVNSDPLTATLYIEALGRGFSPERASDLLREGYTMVVINLRDYANTRNSLLRIRSRLIGTNGSARKRIEQLTDTKISIYGDHVAIIGRPDDVRVASEAVIDLIKGSKHATIFNRLQRIRTILKKDRLRLWENEE
ncbi:MAG: KH domain-containing protein [Nitrososphaeria archaeon]